MKEKMTEKDCMCEESRNLALGKQIKQVKI